MKRKNNEKEMITQTAILEMGWTKAMIKELLPEPVLKPNTYYRNAAPLKLWEKENVLEIMQSDRYKTLEEQSKKRKASAKKAVITKKENLSNKIEIFINKCNIKILDEDKLIKETILHKNNWYAMNENYMEMPINSANIDKEVLQRWIVNYIRHNLVDYDDGLEIMYGKVGKIDTYPKFKEAILKKIASVYPQYAKECERQIMCIRKG